MQPIVFIFSPIFEGAKKIGPKNLLQNHPQLLTKMTEKNRMIAFKDGRKYVGITTGTQARSYRNAAGKRGFYPIKVQLEVLMSPLQVTGDTVTVCTYVNHPGKGVYFAATLLRGWYNQANKLAKGYPKPHGEGTLEILDDRGFDALLRDAR